MSKELHSFLEFEEMNDILKFKYTYKNTLMWPIVRYLIFQEAFVSDEEKNKQYEKENLTPVQKVIDIIYRYFYKNILFCGNNQIMILASNSSKFINKKGKYEDRLFDYYANIYPHSTLIVEKNIFSIENYKRAYFKVVYDDLLEVACRRSVEDKLIEDDLKKINSLIEFIKKNFPVKLDYKFYSFLKKELIEYGSQLYLMDRYYNKLFKKVKPKIVFLEDGCYGYKKSFIIKLLNDLNITTAELQHGSIIKEHWAYNYSPKLINSMEYKKYMPQYLLMFGEFWINSTAISIKKEIIGKQNNIIKNSNNKINNKLILFIASLEHKSYINLLDELLATKEFNYKIILKLHPLEMKNKDKYKRFLKYPNFKLAANGNIYDYLNRVNIVLGDGSTVMYEAYAMNKKVFILNNIYANKQISKNIGVWFDNATELITNLNNVNLYTNSVDSDFYFNSDYKQNYINFIKRFIDKI